MIIRIRKKKKDREEKKYYGRFIDEIPFGIRIIFFLEEKRPGTRNI